MTKIFLKQSDQKNIAYISYEKKKLKCIVGKNGIGQKTREGDFVTPKGIFKLGKVFFRSDRIKKIKSGLPTIKIEKNFVWCVDPKRVEYNKLIKKPANCFYEDLHRMDSLYDIIVTINYNLHPIRKYIGSAIFIHCSEEKGCHTAGCVAMKKNHLVEMLKFLSPSSLLIIC